MGRKKTNKICLYCPVHNGVFCVDKEELMKPEVKCSVCGAVLVLAPKDPNLLFQSLLYKEMELLLRRIEKMIGEK